MLAVFTLRVLQMRSNCRRGRRGSRAGTGTRAGTVRHRFEEVILQLFFLCAFGHFPLADSIVAAACRRAQRSLSPAA